MRTQKSIIEYGIIGLGRFGFNLATALAEAGKEVVFDKVLMVNGVAGKPYLTNVVVKGEVVKQGKQKKVVVFKFNAKHNYHKKQGHRQPYTKVRITSIEQN